MQDSLLDPVWHFGVENTTNCQLDANTVLTGCQPRMYQWLKPTAAGLVTLNAALNVVAHGRPCRISQSQKLLGFFGI